MADIEAQHFPTAGWDEVICTSDYLKAQLMKDDYPIGLKRSLYKKPSLTADDDFHQPSDWEVAGVR